MDPPKPRCAGRNATRTRTLAEWLNLRLVTATPNELRAIAAQASVRA